MANKLLIYVGENQKFDVASAERAIASVFGWHSHPLGPGIGAVLQYQCTDPQGVELIIRITEDVETITIDGEFDTAAAFALAFQAIYPRPLRMIDIDYSFDLCLADFGSAEQLLGRIRQGWRSAD